MKKNPEGGQECEGNTEKRMQANALDISSNKNEILRLIEQYLSN